MNMCVYRVIKQEQIIISDCFSCFNDAGMVGATNQFGYNLGKSVHVLLSQIQEYVFEFNLSHQSQKTESDDMVIYFTCYT